MLDLEKLRIFYYVARELNIGRAAEALRLNTASVSKHIKLLEAHLNKKLIKRKRYGVALTENGESFFAQIASNVANLDNILTTHDFSEKKEKKIKILTTDGALSSIIAKEIAEFLKMNNNINVVINTQKKPDILQSQEDFGILPFQSKTKGISQTVILELHSRLYAHKTYIEKYGLPKDSKDLDNHKFIGYSSERLYSSVNLDWYLDTENASVKRNALLQINSPLGQFEALRAGLGILGIVREFSLLKNEDFVEILPNEEGRTFRVCFVKREDEIQTKTEKDIEAFLRSRFETYAHS
ncbi:MAG: LysR family transcriptional regulator [Alphaproteobacteria bacterium]|nr:LysR family transcriptional regulator [Alphaproteobacteria bacterium]NCQ67248.1 LysR family transcriptional regulator [Alphaproteobacteria bacterium]NCT07091.1 LysR family transcriptional regulator [Alphaproteobacteria bacterium]